MQLITTNILLASLGWVVLVVAVTTQPVPVTHGARVDGKQLKQKDVTPQHFRIS